MVWGAPLYSVNPLTIEMGLFTSILHLWEVLVQQFKSKDV